MITLAMDTAYRHLIVGLFDDTKLLAGTSFECFKKQSENLFPELEKALEKAGLTMQDIDQVVITDGPGSYTGVRIAMTVAKVLASQRQIPLYTISTLQLYAGTAPAVNVLLDARGHRAYAGHVENGVLTEPETILTEAEYRKFRDSHPGSLMGDVPVEGTETVQPDFLQNFIDLQAQWVPVKNVHAAVPRYLKESDAYKTAPAAAVAESHAG